MKNRTLIGLLCIVLAVLTTFVISPMVNRMSEGKTETVRFTKDLSQGAQISDADVEVAKLTRSSLPQGFLAKKSDVVGKFANVDLYQGDIATAKKLTTDANNSVNILNALSGSKVAMSITIKSLANGLSAKLMGGDIISIYVTDKDNKTTVPSTLKYVRVITTTTAGGVDEPDVVENEDGTKALPTTVTVLVSVKQAQQLANFEKNATMHVALVYRGEEKTANKFIAKQDKYLKNLEKEEKADG